MSLLAQDDNSSEGKLADTTFSDKAEKQYKPGDLTKSKPFVLFQRHANKALPIFLVSFLWTELRKKDKSA